MYRFIDHNIKPSFPSLEELNKEIDDNHLKMVVILRPTLFFYASQEITLTKLKEYFTEHAITKLFGDGFAKFKEDE